MWRYFSKRVIFAVITIFLVIFISFFLMHAVPGGPFQSEKAPDPAVRAMLEKRAHLDKPIFVRFGYYVEGIFKGDFGISLKTGRDILKTITTSFKISAKIGGLAALGALIFGLSLGMLAALNRNKWPDRVIIFFTTLFVSVPSFVLATLLLIVFSQILQWVPTWSIQHKSIVLPIVALMLYPLSYITRLTKSSMLDVLGQDYIRTARAKGVSTIRVIVKHGLKNAVLPVITYIGPMLAFILTGSLVVEKVFTVGGLGTEFVNSITQQDYPMIMGTTIFLATIMIFLNLSSDVIYKFIDPRIKFE